MESTDVRDSPYITNWDLVPPSPSHDNLDIDQSSPFDPAFNISENNQQVISSLTSPGYPATPSYNGSYFNSPYSQHSDLPELDFLPDFPSSTTAMNDYEPSEYDAPSTGNTLLMYTSDTDFMSPHLSPNTGGPDGHRTRGSPFDHSSPASSPGIDDNNQAGRHSRASSVASNQPSPSAQQAATHSPQPPFHPSPRLDVLQSFGNMSVRTPNWTPQSLPNAHSPHIGTDSLPPQQKPQSPPRLTMPSGMSFDPEATAVPKINAPDGDDDLGGPSFNIVPATPVTGGDASGRQHLPFQRTLDTLTQGVELITDTEQQPQRTPSQRASPYGSPHVVPSNLLPSSIFPEDQDIRQRRNSDGWPGATFDQSQNQLGMSDNAYGFQQQPQISPPIDEHRQQLQSFTFGGNSGAANSYLAGGDGIRRSVSDSLAAPRIHRQSRSEEIRPIPAFANAAGFQAHHGQSNSISTTGFLFPPSNHTDFIQRQQQQQQNHFLHPNDLPTSTSVSGLQPPIVRRSLSPGMGHYRRASSGSRSGRGAEVWGTQADQLAPSSIGIRRMSPYPTPNASPRVNYTELDPLNELNLGNQNLGIGPTGSGLGVGAAGLGLTVGLGVEVIPGLGEPPVSAGYADEVPIAGRSAYNQAAVAAAAAAAAADGASSHHAESVHSGVDQPPGPVTKHNVTTGRTANASIRRRKQEATFICKVPGCGSTFTRGFNLKGHMRSHYEQKPYKCHWPGCDKGFARQHDCKRHEQLHSNYRPFVCDGCGKNFARMDALNRHLRSEAGAECARAVEEKREGELGGVGGDEDDGRMDEDDEKKPYVENQSRRRNVNVVGGGLPDKVWL